MTNLLESARISPIKSRHEALSLYHRNRSPVSQYYKIMLRIRFQRLGKKKQPEYRIILSEGTRDTQYTNTEILGTYNPTTKKLALNKEKVQYWIGVGAQPSASLHNLFMREGLITGKKQKSVYLSKKRKVKIAAKKATAAA